MPCRVLFKCVFGLLHILRQVFFHHKIVYDEVLAFHGVLSHIVFQKLLHLVGLMQRDLFESHLRTDEVREFLG